MAGVATGCCSPAWVTRRRRRAVATLQSKAVVRQPAELTIAVVAKRKLAPAPSECWIVAEAIAGWEPAPRWKRSSARTTAFRLMEPPEAAGGCCCLRPGAVMERAGPFLGDRYHAVLRRSVGSPELAGVLAGRGRLHWPHRGRGHLRVCEDPEVRCCFGLF